MHCSLSKDRRLDLIQKLKDAASRLIEEDDPWLPFQLHKVPAERIVRHIYDPVEDTWHTDETIVKVEKEAFTKGAMRHCYRMKKMAMPPSDASNHRFHKGGWKRALNYVAKAYHTQEGHIDTSEAAKQDVQNDVQLQYEAQRWSLAFNDAIAHVGGASTINFIRAYAIEFPDRPGKPWMAVERFIHGSDRYGASFVKHNTNSGYVEAEHRRITPQLFSAYSFYASHGNRLVADIQGVADLYTDPQVLSSDYRFGDGDLGPRGMAFFFKGFRHSEVSDSLGIPIFALSKNELKAQIKYHDDELTVSDDSTNASHEGFSSHNAFQRMDFNRISRKSLLMTPISKISVTNDDTARRSNMSSRAMISQSFRHSMTTNGKMSKSPVHLKRSKSDVDEVTLCLVRATEDLEFTMDDFHRHANGALRARRHHSNSEIEAENSNNWLKASVRNVAAPMIPDAITRENLGKVHYQLAVLHGLGRFPEVVPAKPGEDPEDRPDHDVFSVLFHLSYAAALHNAPACLALGRLQSNLESHVSSLLTEIVSVDFARAEEMLRRTMTSPYHHSLVPKVAAGCLLFQMLHDEAHLTEECTDTWRRGMIDLIEEILQLMSELEKERKETDAKREKRKAPFPTMGIDVGDRVEANYALEGTYYPATVTNICDKILSVRYDDDDSEETLPTNQVRLIIPPTATQTSLGGPLSDEEVFGTDKADDSILLQRYELIFELAQLKERIGEVTQAHLLYQEAADGALDAGKVKTATEWSLRAADL